MGEYFIVLLSAKHVEMLRVRLLSLKAVTNTRLSKHVELKQLVAQVAVAGGGHSSEHTSLHIHLGLQNSGT